MVACGDSDTNTSATDPAGSSEATGTPTSSTGDSVVTTGETAEAGTGTGETGETGEPPLAGMPEGVSVWKGEGEIVGLAFPIEFTITNTKGDLTASLTLSDSPDSPMGIGTVVYTASGTHEPTVGLVALAPKEWTIPPDVPLALYGFSGAYDPMTNRLIGRIADYAGGTDGNVMQGGPATLDLVDGGDGEPTMRGDEAASLVVGSRSFTGTTQCTGDVREVAGMLAYDGAGGVSGTLTVGNSAIETPFGTFEVSGVHNPSTGGITLAPGLWIEDDVNVVNFFVDGTYDPATRKYDGDQRTNLAACPPATWHVTFE